MKINLSCPHFLPISITRPGTVLVAFKCTPLLQGKGLIKKYIYIYINTNSGTESVLNVQHYFKFPFLILMFINSNNTRQNFHLHQPQANLTLYQKGAYYSGIKGFNNLPSNIRNLSCDVTRFKLELGKYLNVKSFYTPEEYYNSCKS